MHATCLHCTKSLGANEVLETLPIGRRIAFDAAQGRLWVVCPHCAKWNLVPFDTRLETIDAAERLFRETRTRYSTDNIGLAKVREGLELVRIGSALRPEFAAWRYGEGYRRRRQAARGRMLAGAGVITAASMTVGAALGAPLLVGGLLTCSFLPWHYFLSRLHPFSQMKLPRGRSWYVVSLQSAVIQQATIVWRADGPAIEIPEWEPAAYGPYQSTIQMSPYKATQHSWSGTEFRTIGRRIVGLLNTHAGSTREIADAAEVVGEHSGDLTPFLQEVATTRIGAGKAPRYIFSTDPPYWREYTGTWLLVGKMPPAQRLALELWMNEDIERTWLEGELKLLEREWQEAERLAKIADELAFEAAGVGEESR
ncbi:MAG: hypothetical protein KC544_11935 [Gemmatimonadetes bacterium]|nr:hypothetical protein [Gemmatimonadota bacterium]